MSTKCLCIFLYIVSIGAANGKEFEIGGRAVIGCRVSQALFLLEIEIFALFLLEIEIEIETLKLNILFGT